MGREGIVTPLVDDKRQLFEQATPIRDFNDNPTGLFQVTSKRQQPCDPPTDKFVLLKAHGIQVSLVVIQTKHFPRIIGFLRESQQYVLNLKGSFLSLSKFLLYIKFF